MKLSRKQLTLGTLATIAAVAVPIATVVSCGSKKIDTSKFDRFVISEELAKADKTPSATKTKAVMEEGLKLDAFKNAHIDSIKKTLKKDFVLEFRGKEYVFTSKMSRDEIKKVFAEFTEAMKK